LSGRVSGKRILVTGGATGLGAAFVRRLAAEGAVLFIGDIDESAGAALAKEMGSTFIPLDVASEDSLEELPHLAVSTVSSTMRVSPRAKAQRILRASSFPISTAFSPSTSMAQS
jgi:NAD(P)-dependent dehydrogenase (short-subunit alcohol dehydrogenase family)